MSGTAKMAIRVLPVAWGYPMGERRKARRYELYLPVQVCLPRERPVEFYTGQLRDVSRSGIFFHSHIPLEHGAALELTFSLPAERDRGTSVLVRASAKALRVSELPGDGAACVRRSGNHRSHRFCAAGRFERGISHQTTRFYKLDSWEKRRGFSAAPFFFVASS